MRIKNWIFGSVATGLTFFSSCNTQNNSDNLNDGEDYTLSESVSDNHVYGYVTDGDGRALANVLVTTGNDTVLTSESGAYYLEKCRAVNGRCVVKFESRDYFTVIRTANVDDGDARLDAMLMLQDIKDGVTDVSRFYNSQGATINVGKMTVDIPANSLVYEDGKPFNGSVFASTYYLNPKSENFVNEMPGGDMSGVDSTGKSVILLSYGMVEVTLKDSVNRKLQLKDGSESTLTFPSTEGLKSYDKIPLWYFDENKGTWVEEGIATKEGDHYTGKVKHFSWHNLDYPNKRATICGRVTNQEGKPLSGIKVTISQTYAYTDANGNYCAFVPQLTDVFVTVKSSDYANCPNCPIHNVSGLKARTTFKQDLVLPTMPCIHGKVTDPDGRLLSGVAINSTITNVRTITNVNGEYFIFYNGNEPISFSIKEYANALNEDANMSKTNYKEYNNQKEYTFDDPAEIDLNASYDFIISRPIYIYGNVYVSNNQQSGYYSCRSITSPVTVTAVLDNKEYKIKTSESGHYLFKASAGTKEISTYVKAENGYGIESTKSTKKISGDDYRWINMPYIKIPSGYLVKGSIINTCGPSKAKVIIEVGKGKNKTSLTKYTRFGDFDFDLPISLKGSKLKMSIVCCGKKFTKKAELDKKDIDFGTISLCSKTKIEPNCIYAIIGDKTVKFDTKKDKHTELFQSTMSNKYQVWYKNSDFDGILILEIKSWGESRQLSAYLLSDDISALKTLEYTKANKEEEYKFNTDCDLNVEGKGNDGEIYLYGSATIKYKDCYENIDNDILPDNYSNLLIGVNNSTKFYSLKVSKENTKELEKSLISKGFKENSTFMDDEKRISTIFLKENTEALLHRNKDNTSEVSILKREGIDKQPLYQCWKVDFKNSSLKGKGKSVDYMWKNEADIAQLVMFGPIMGIKFTKTDITEQKCGCSTGNGPTVAN